jgi:hypothetical protein
MSRSTRSKTASTFHLSPRPPRYSCQRLTILKAPRHPPPDLHRSPPHPARLRQLLHGLRQSAFALSLTVAYFDDFRVYPANCFPINPGPVPHSAAQPIKSARRAASDPEFRSCRMPGAGPFQPGPRASVGCKPSNQASACSRSPTAAETIAMDPGPEPVEREPAGAQDLLRLRFLYRA